MAVEQETGSKPRREEINNGQALDTVTTMIMLVFITGWTIKMSFYWRNWRGTRWCSWLRHCATSWKVAGSIADRAIFHWLYLRLSL